MKSETLSLPRRAFLRASGLSLALPAMESLMGKTPPKPETSPATKRLVTTGT